MAWRLSKPDRICRTRERTSSRESAQHVARDALRSLVSAQEGERHRLAREPHDETGQALTSILLGLKPLEESLARVRRQPSPTCASSSSRRFHAGRHRLGRAELDANAAPPPLPQARAGAARRGEPVRALEPGVIELAPGVHALGHGAGGRVRALLIADGGELTLVDPLFERDARLVREAIHALGRTPSDLKRIGITHTHRSHLGGLAELKHRSGATAYAHP
jgi:Metallo-beta-lactamase superfamily/Histidine kinase